MTRKEINTHMKGGFTVACLISIAVIALNFDNTLIKLVALLPAYHLGIWFDLERKARKLKT